MDRRKRGFAMTYAIVLILIVSLLVSVLLITAQLTAKSSASYQNYIDGKNYLDNIGSAAIENYTGDNKKGWENNFSGNAFGYTIREESDGDAGTVEVYVLNSQKVELYIKFTKSTENAEEAYKLSAYIYNYGYYNVQEDTQQTS